MDPNTMHSPPSLDLPRPTPELDEPVAPQADRAPERKRPTEAGKTEQPGSAMPDPPPALPTAMPPLPTGVQSTTPSPTAGLPADDHAPALADDVDLIEKEWVTKAKAIVARTRDDPHQQNKELNKIKASYIKKRYNKELRVSEE